MSGWPLYDVFLSFRGPDVRSHFADFLHHMLVGVGISVFRDEEELESGQEIDPQLIQAIEQSKISLPVISNEYKSSRSCLLELVHMVGCMDNNRQTIIPIFYNVKPSDLSNCRWRGPFKNASDERPVESPHALDEDQKLALRRIGALKGHHHVDRSDKSHAKYIKKIVYEVEMMLKKRDLLVPKQLVGVDPHAQEIMAKLNVDHRNGQVVRKAEQKQKVDHRNGQAVKSGDCEKVLIYGIPGVGKTVLAKCVYNKLNHLYDACSFLGDIQAEIKRGGEVSVQNRLISALHKKKYAQKFDCSDEALKHLQDKFHTMKALVLLDDVKDREQLSKLVGELEWLGLGSTVIVTSQRDDVLKNLKGAESFGLRKMQEDKALQLFSRHAFGKDSPPKEFEDWSKNIVAAVDGLPLALKNVGDDLNQIQVEVSEVWRETLTALEQAPEKSVRDAFFKSYNTLKEIERDIFLDIACFFDGMDKRIPDYMWEDCNYFPLRSILSLRAMSLVEIGEDEELCMRGILKTFGREIVNSKKEPRKRSRLFNHKDALGVLKRREGTGKVEALGLEFGEGSKGNIRFGCDKFKNLHNLRFLKLDQADIQGNFRDLLSSLRWLDWRGCPKIFNIQSLNLNLQELLILDLSGSQVDKDWRGWDLLVEVGKLKVLKLTGCVQLTATPEFPASMELERLILEGCSNLAVIHPSFVNLTKLVSLNVKQCSLLCELPNLGPTRSLEELLIDGTSISRITFQKGSMMKLKTLSAHNCKNMTNLSDLISYLKSLKYLALDSTGIVTLGESIGSLEKLETLSLKNCRGLSNLPDGIGKLRSLQFLDLSGTLIDKLPPSVEDLKDMKVLRMRGTSIQEFPKAILDLQKLEEIDFSSCQSLEGKVPLNIRGLSSLVILKLSDTRICGLPPRMSHLSRLRELHILRCYHLQIPPKLPCLVNVFRDSGN